MQITALYYSCTIELRALPATRHNKTMTH